MYICVIINVTTFFLLFTFFNEYKLINFLSRKWSRSVLFFLKITNNVSHEIINLDKVPDGPCIIACKHQSMWDTIIFHAILNSPAYIYKKELHKVPIYGWYIKKLRMIPVDRTASASALKGMIRKSKELVLDQKRKLIIFPQGTRTPPGSSTQDYPYQIGVAALYKSLNVKVIPVALNSGKFWGKGCYIRNRGKIKLKFLDPIEPGLDKKEFMRVIEEKIESESGKLV